MIGYACIAVAVPGSKIMSCMARSASYERLIDITRFNLNALNTLINYNNSNEIGLFRICSELIPFGSSPVNTTDWQKIFNAEFKSLADKIREASIRISMHPGQYTVINSIDEGVVLRAYEDLRYHSRVLDALGGDIQNKIILHIGGVYGDKKSAIKRFIDAFSGIPDRAKCRIAIENDDKFFNIKDALEISSALSIPVIYDVLHNEINPYNEDSDNQWIMECKKTWGTIDGKQKIHYSEQEPGRRSGSHSRGISAEKFFKFYISLTEIPDIMLEVKNKNISALKCLAITNPDNADILKAEYKRYEMTFLSKGSDYINEARELVKACNTFGFYQLIENIENMPLYPQGDYFALRTVADYLYNNITLEEADALERALSMYAKGKHSIAPVKLRLQDLAAKYGNEIQYSYFLNS
jgi:UV DNA damage endonuclease